MNFNYLKMKNNLKTKIQNFFLVALPLASVLISTEVKSQAAITCTPGASCTFGDFIDAFSLNGILAVGNTGCNSGGYSFYPTPVFALTMGNTYNWTCSMGPTWQQGLAVWIDLNNDGFYTANEQLANSPSATNHAGSFYMPFTAIAGTNRSMRIRCQFGTTIPNTNSTACDPWFYGETEDYLVDIIAPPPCTSVPAANTVVAPSIAICPGSAASLSLANTYTTYGFTYAWQSATLSPFGPYTAVSGATTSAIVVPNQTITTYYQAVITCTNVTGSYSASAGQVTVSPVITDNVPYFEGFEGIQANDKLPNCSWSATNLGANALTYIASNTQGRTPRTGTKFASFFYNPGGSYYFYTNGIYMNAGVTYSASLWYQTEYFGYNNFSNFSIFYGTTQSNTGLTPIASTNGPAISNIYKQLSNTFQVPTSGLYYVAIGTTVTTGSFANYLTWDDLSITIPCDQVAPNTPTLSLLANQTNVCQGQSVNLTASGANTYTWSNGSNLSAVTEMPQNAGTAYYTVVGTNTLSGCTRTLTQAITVNSLPGVFVVASSPSVCSGSQVILTGVGAMTYTWNTNSNAPVISVVQTNATTYTVLGSNTNGCIGMASVLVGKYELPTISAQSGAPTKMCLGEYVTLTAAGSSSSYLWTSNTFPIVIGNSISVNPISTTVFTVTGTDANGCMNKTTLVQNVDMCTGLRETGLNTSKVYPNPTSGIFTVELTSASAKTIIVTDLSGRIVLNTTSTDQKVSMNLSDLANGIYYVKIQSDKGVEVTKIVKN